MPPISTDRQPSLYVAQGAPNLIEHPGFTKDLRRWGDELGRPRAALIVSSHWEEDPVTVGSTSSPVPVYYDHDGWPSRYYAPHLTYAPPGAPWLRALIGEHLGPVAHRIDRGLDHGAFVPLFLMWPDASVPVIQISLPTLDAKPLFDLGRQLRPLRDEGVMIYAAGLLTHTFPPQGTGDVDTYHEDPGRAPEHWNIDPPAASAEFVDWVDDAVRQQDVDALLDWDNRCPAGREAHVSYDTGVHSAYHIAPFFVALGAATDLGSARKPTDGWWYGLSMRSYQFD
jgi:4,5-DOPA dioxygenase extradiol